MRERITRALIDETGIQLRRHRRRLAGRRAHRPLRPALEYSPSEWTAFARFPTWMWRNDEVRELRRLAARAQRTEREPQRRVGFPRTRSLQPATTRSAPCSTISRTSTRRRRRSRASATAASRRGKPIRPAYGHAALTGSYRSCESDVVAMLGDILRESDRTMRSGTASASSTRCRTRVSSPTPSATTAPCTTARARRGTCATATCSTP